MHYTDRRSNEADSQGVEDECLINLGANGSEHDLGLDSGAHGMAPRAHGADAHVQDFW